MKIFRRLLSIVLIAVALLLPSTAKAESVCVVYSQAHIGHGKLVMFQNGVRTRFATPIHAGVFDVSPDGEEIVFSYNDALGAHTGIVNTRANSTRRFYDQSVDFFLHPTFSPSGQQYAVVVWQKDVGISVRVVESGFGASSTIYPPENVTISELRWASETGLAFSVQDRDDDSIKYVSVNLETLDQITLTSTQYEDIDVPDTAYHGTMTRAAAYGKALDCSPQ